MFKSCLVKKDDAHFRLCHDALKSVTNKIKIKSISKKSFLVNYVNNFLYRLKRGFARKQLQNLSQNVQPALSEKLILQPCVIVLNKCYIYG